MADYAIYAEKLLSLNHGYALYDPDPMGRYDLVRPGDVGHVDSNGKFIKAFNIFFSENDPINDRGVPEHFEQFNIDHRDLDRRSAMSPGVLHSSSVKVIGTSLDISGTAMQIGATVTLRCSKRQGAALLIRNQPVRIDAIPRRRMGNYMLQNHDSWFRFIRDTLRRDVEISDIVMVTRCDLTTDWATTAFTDKNIDGSISFQAGNPTLSSAQFSFWASVSESTSTSHRSGPQTPPHGIYGFQPSPNTFLIQSADSVNTPDGNFNQCIFIRGYRVLKQFRKSKLEELALKAGAGDNKLPGRDNDDPPSASGVSTEAELTTNLSKGLQNDSLSDNQRIKTVYDIALEYILEQSDADIALVHDEDLYRVTYIMKDRNHLMSLLRRMKRVITEIWDNDVVVGFLAESMPIESTSDAFAKLKIEEEVPSDQEEHRNEQTEREIMKRPPGACARCKFLKVRCQFATDTRICIRCLLGKHECVIPGRMRRRRPIQKNEHLLDEIRQHRAKTENLLKELDETKGLVDNMAHASSAVLEKNPDSEKATLLLNKIWTQHALMEVNVKKFEAVHDLKRWSETSETLEVGSTSWSASGTMVVTPDVDDAKPQNYIHFQPDVQVESWLTHVNKSVKAVGEMINVVEYGSSSDDDELEDLEEMEEEKDSDEVIENLKTDNLSQTKKEI